MAFQFVPTTLDGRRYGKEKAHPRWSLWRYYGAFPKGYQVLITGGVATASPGATSLATDTIAAADSGSGEGGKAWFRGGCTYTVTAAEKTILEAAGYTVDTV